MNKLITLMAIVLLSGCQEEPIEPTEPMCDCHEVHEQLEVVDNGSGLPTLEWVIQYETTPANMPCSSETEYTSVNNSQRWKVICQ